MTMAVIRCPRQHRRWRYLRGRRAPISLAAFADWMNSLRRFFAETPEAAVGEIGLDKGSHGKTIDFGEQANWTFPSRSVVTFLYGIFRNGVWPCKFRLLFTIWLLDRHEIH